MVEFFFGAYKEADIQQIVLECVVFVFGILSVWYAGKQNIGVYPTGLIATVISVYLLYKVGLFGDMILNGYYSMMSLFGWYNWSKASNTNEGLKISRTTVKEKWHGVFLFLLTVGVVYVVYYLVGQEIEPANYIDMFTSGIFFTAMYYMALKKIENWTLWVIGNCISIPLYGFRDLGILALQFVVFLVLAIMAYISWYKILKQDEVNGCR